MVICLVFVLATVLLVWQNRHRSSRSLTLGILLFAASQLLSLVNYTFAPWARRGN